MIFGITGRLKVPENVSLVHLPLHAPELSPVERVRLHLKQRYLFHRIFASTSEITHACAKAWNDLAQTQSGSPDAQIVHISNG
jgi:hypothetical protein